MIASTKFLNKSTTLLRRSKQFFPVLSWNNTRTFSSDSYEDFESIPPPLSQLTEAESMLKDHVSRFAQEKIKPLSKAMDENQTMDSGLIKQLFEEGYMGIETLPELGGTGMNFMSSVIVIEELAKVDPSVSVMVDVQNTLASTCIRKWGTEDQKNHFLPILATQSLGSFCLSEWESGSDAFALKTKATKQGDHYILQGTKAWITNSLEAGVFICFANVAPEKGYKGITAFLLDKNDGGIEIGKKEDKLGIRASSTCEVIFNDTKVHESNVLGEVGKGYKIAIECLNEGRIGIAAQMLGLAQGALNETMPYLNQRKQFGTTISDFQGMQFTYAQAYSEIEAARLLTYNAARLQENGKPFILEASMAKLLASQVAEKVASGCVNMLGGVGFTKEFPVERYYRDCKIGQIYEGTSNVQLKTIADYLQRNVYPKDN